MTLTLLGSPADVRLEDHPDSGWILGRESDRRRALLVTTVAWDSLAGATVAAVGALLLLAIDGPLILDTLGITSLTVGMPDTIIFLFSFSPTPIEISMSVGPGVLGIGTITGLIYAFVQSYQRTRSPIDEPANDR